MTAFCWRLDGRAAWFVVTEWDGVIPVAQILERVTPAYGGDTWDEALAGLLSRPCDAATIRNLTEHASGGLFSVPVVVDPEDLRVANGMHRVAATVVSGGDSILCSSRYPSEFEDADPNADEFVEVEFTLPQGVTGCTEDCGDDDPLGFVSCWLRSFPLPDGTWVESDTFAAQGGTLSGLWYCPEDRMNSFISELTRRAPGIKVSKSRSVTWAELDAEYSAAGY